MVRETRHLWVGNLPETVREDRIREHFKRSSDDHSPGYDRTSFYDRSNSRLSDQETPTNTTSGTGGQFIRRPNSYHSTTNDGRGRTRDRHYRNGPYSTIIDRSNPVPHHRITSNNWYENSSSGNSSSRSIYGNVASAVVQPDSTYDHNNSRNNSIDSIENLTNNSKSISSTLVPANVHLTSSLLKKKKSRSGSESPGSVSSRSHSRSPSSSSSTNSTTSNSNASSSSPISGSDHPRGNNRNLQSTVSAPVSNSSNSSSSGTQNPAVHSEDNRPLAICVRNLPARSSDTSLKDGLFHEYKKHGKVTWVKVVGQNTDRYALVCFKKPEDVDKALEVSRDKLFFGCKIDVAPYQGYDVDDNEFRPYEAELDEYHPKSTRTLFIGNLEKDITSSELRKHFDCFGEIIEIDIKKQGVNAYAFCQYADIISVVKAMRKMDGEHLGNNRVKLGFGKSMPTNCVWIDGVAENVTETYLTSQFNRFGTVSHVQIDRERKLALVFFDQIQFAQTAVKEMRGVMMRGKKLQVDFASRECQEAFFDKTEKQSGVERASSVSSATNVVAFDPATTVSASTTVREVSTRGFETTVCVPGNRYGTGSSGRYENSGRGRTSSFSRPNNPVSGANSPSSTQGATTPRSGRTRTLRYASDYYDSGSNDYVERRFRSYDEYSQGSGASHEDLYEHDSYNYSSSRERGESPVTRLSGSGGVSERIVNDDVISTSSSSSKRRCDKSPGKIGDIRHLQKERVHLLEQLEKCPSSGDEAVSPKKRLKYTTTNSVNSSESISNPKSMEYDRHQIIPPSSSTSHHSHHHHHHHHNVNVQNSSNLDSSSNCDSIHQQQQQQSSSSSVPPYLQSSSQSSNSGGGGGHHHHHHHHSSSSGDLNLLQQQQSAHRKGVEIRRLSECSGSTGNKHSSLSSTAVQSVMHSSNNSSSNSISINNNSHRRPSTDSLITTNAAASSGSLAAAVGMTRHDSTHSMHGMYSSAAQQQQIVGSGIKRRRTGSSVNEPPSSSSLEYHHSSRGRGHQLHSLHSHEASGGESADGSRPGTPLCDERPENFLPSEPRRTPRERTHEPMSLPLPKFAAQFFQQLRQQAATSGLSTLASLTSMPAALQPLSSQNNLTNTTTNSSLNTILSSPPASSNSGPMGFLSKLSTQLSTSSTSSSTAAIANAVTTPHLETIGGHSTAPASPSRPPSISDSNSSDSEGGGGGGGTSTGAGTVPRSTSPSLADRIKNLDEMFEKWSGGNAGRTHSSTIENTSLSFSNSAYRHKFLDLDVNEVKPSDIVKSVLAKKSIFDDDSKRLENIGDKYEPREFVNYSRQAISTGVSGTNTVPVAQVAATPPVVVTSNTVPAVQQPTVNPNLVPVLTIQQPHPSPPVVLNPTISRALSSGANSPLLNSPYSSPSTNTPIIKGLQYPFPSHPPITTVASATSSTTSLVGTAASGTTPPTTSVESTITPPVATCKITPPPPAIPSTPETLTATTPTAVSSSSSSSSSLVTITTTTTTITSAAATTSNSCASNASLINNNNNITTNTNKPKTNLISNKSISLTETSSNKPLSTNNNINLNNKSNNNSDSNSKTTATPTATSSSSSATITPTTSQPNPLRVLNKSASVPFTTTPATPTLTKSLSTGSAIPAIKSETAVKPNSQNSNVVKSTTTHPSAVNHLHEKTDTKKSSEERSNSSRRQHRDRRKGHSESTTGENNKQEEDHSHEPEIKSTSGKSERKDHRKKEHRDDHEKEKRSADLEKKLEPEDKKPSRIEIIKREDVKLEPRVVPEIKEEFNLSTEKPKVVEVKKEECENSKKLEAKDNRPPSKRRLSSVGQNEVTVNADSLTEEPSKRSKSTEHRKIPDRRDSREPNTVTASSATLQTPNQKYKYRTLNKTINREAEKRKTIEQHQHQQTKESCQSADGAGQVQSKPTADRVRKSISMETTTTEKQTEEKSGKDQNCPTPTISEDTAKIVVAPVFVRENHRDNPKDKENSQCSNNVDRSFDNSMDIPSDDDDNNEEDAANEYRRRRRMNKESKRSGDEKHDGLDDPSADRKNSSRNTESSEDSTRRKKSYRKLTSINSSDESNDGSKKHSIFDIPDEGPTYISMYDKVKARSCKNMQKQEEKKSIKDKFSQLKQSRAKRGEKKRSNSWDGEETDESDDTITKQHHNYKGALLSSSNEDEEGNHSGSRRRRMHKEAIISDSESDVQRRLFVSRPHRPAIQDISGDGESSEGSPAFLRLSKPRRKISSRKNSRSTRIQSDTSDDDHRDKTHSSDGKKNKPIVVLTDVNKVKVEEIGSFDAVKVKEEDTATTGEEIIKPKVKQEQHHKKSTIFSTSDFSTDDADPIKNLIKTEPLLNISPNTIKKETKSDIVDIYKFSTERFSKICDPSSESEPLAVQTPKKGDPKDAQSFDSIFAQQQQESRNKKHKKNKKRKSITSGDVSASDQRSSVDETKTSGPTPIMEISDQDDKKSKAVLNEAASVTQNLHEQRRSKHGSKKDKKREKLKDPSNIERSASKEERIKLKKAKKANKEVTSKFSTEQSATKREEKMEDIFGPLSDDDDENDEDDSRPLIMGGTNEPTVVPTAAPVNKQTSSSLFDQLLSQDKENNETQKQNSTLSGSENAFNFGHDATGKEATGKEKDRQKDESRKRKEKKRKEREKIRQAAAIKEDENSVDLDAAGRALEAQLMSDSETKPEEMSSPSTATTTKSTPGVSGGDMMDVFRFTDGDDSTEASIPTADSKHRGVDDSQSRKEKKKKKKRAKEEKHGGKHHHHHHHHSSSNSSSMSATKVSSSTENTTSEIGTLKMPTDAERINQTNISKASPSLPCLLDDSPPPSVATPIRASSPNHCNNKPVPIPLSPIVHLKKLENNIPGFGTKIDDKIHETAVLSIANDYPSKNIDLVKVEEPISEPTTSKLKIDEKPEEKSRVVISQEETEDAVAALLGESFGTNNSDFEVFDEPIIPEVSTSPAHVEEPQIPEVDAEEMKKAIQSLNAEELDIKPDTPQSEHDLQIDTDGEHEEETSVPQFEVPPKTPEIEQHKMEQLTLDERKKKEEEELNLVAAKVIQRDIVKPTPVVVAATTTCAVPPIITSTTSSVITKSLPSTMSSFQRKPMVFVPASKTADGVGEAVTLAAAVKNTIKIVTTVPTMTQATTTLPSTTTGARPPHSQVIFQNAIGGQKIVTQVNHPAQQFASLSPQGQPKTNQVRAGSQFVMQPPTITIPDPQQSMYSPGMSPRSGDTRINSPNINLQYQQQRNASPTSPTVLNRSGNQQQQIQPGMRHSPQLSPVISPHGQVVTIQSRQILSSSSPNSPRQQSPPVIHSGNGGNVVINRIPITNVMTKTNQPGTVVLAQGTPQKGQAQQQQVHYVQQPTPSTTTKIFVHNSQQQQQQQQQNVRMPLQQTRTIHVQQTRHTNPSAVGQIIAQPGGQALHVVQQKIIGQPQIVYQQTKISPQVAAAAAAAANKSQQGQHVQLAHLSAQKPTPNTPGSVEKSNKSVIEQTNSGKASPTITKTQNIMVVQRHASPVQHQTNLVMQQIKPGQPFVVAQSGRTGVSSPVIIQQPNSPVKQSTSNQKSLPVTIPTVVAKSTSHVITPQQSPVEKPTTTPIVSDQKLSETVEAKKPEDSIAVSTIEPIQLSKEATPLQQPQKTEIKTDVGVTESKKLDEVKPEPLSVLINSPSTTETVSKIFGKEDKEDNEYWSANIESVIQKIDQICSEDDEELSRAAKQETPESAVKPEEQKDIVTVRERKESECSTVSVKSEKSEKKQNDLNDDEDLEDVVTDQQQDKEPVKRGRGRKKKGEVEKAAIPVSVSQQQPESPVGIQTRRGKTVQTPAKRGGKAVATATSSTSRSSARNQPQTPVSAPPTPLLQPPATPVSGQQQRQRTQNSESDVYEFHDDSGEEVNQPAVKTTEAVSGARPRLILTIKSQASGTTNTTSSAPTTTTPASDAQSVVTTVISSTTTATTAAEVPTAPSIKPMELEPVSVVATSSPTQQNEVVASETEPANESNLVLSTTPAILKTSSPPATPAAQIQPASPSPQTTPDPSKIEFAQPQVSTMSAAAAAALNTRKSRRLQERDGSRNTVDDIIEDVVRNAGTSPKGQILPTPASVSNVAVATVTPVVTTSTAAASAVSTITSTPRRSTRQNNNNNNTTTKSQQATQPPQHIISEKAAYGISAPPDVRKSPRSTRKNKDKIGVNAQEGAVDAHSSSDERSTTKSVDISSDEEKVSQTPLSVPQPIITAVPTSVVTSPSTTLVTTNNKVGVPVQVSSEMLKDKKPGEPLTLIDPVTGELTIVTQSREGQYVPVPGSTQAMPVQKVLSPVINQLSATITTNTPVISTAAPVLASTHPSVLQSITTTRIVTPTLSATQTMHPSAQTTPTVVVQTSAVTVPAPVQNAINLEVKKPSITAPSSPLPPVPTTVNTPTKSNLATGTTAVIQQTPVTSQSQVAPPQMYTKHANYQIPQSAPTVLQKPLSMAPLHPPQLTPDHPKVVTSVQMRVEDVPKGSQIVTKQVIHQQPMQMSQQPQHHQQQLPQTGYPTVLVPPSSKQQHHIVQQSGQQQPVISKHQQPHNVPVQAHQKIQQQTVQQQPQIHQKVQMPSQGHVKVQQIIQQTPIQQQQQPKPVLQPQQQPPPQAHVKVQQQPQPSHLSSSSIYPPSPGSNLTINIPAGTSIVGGSSMSPRMVVQQQPIGVKHVPLTPQQQHAMGMQQQQQPQQHSNIQLTKQQPQQPHQQQQYIVQQSHVQPQQLIIHNSGGKMPATGQPIGYTTTKVVQQPSKQQIIHQTPVLQQQQPPQQPISKQIQQQILISQQQQSQISSQPHLQTIKIHQTKLSADQMQQHMSSKAQKHQQQLQQQQQKQQLQQQQQAMHLAAQQHQVSMQQHGHSGPMVNQQGHIITKTIVQQQQPQQKPSVLTKTINNTHIQQQHSQSVQPPPSGLTKSVIGLHQTPLTGAVASPPLKQPHLPSQQPVVAGASSSRVSGPPISPQGAGQPSRAQIFQAGMPAFEASVGDGSFSPSVSLRGMPREYMYQLIRAQEGLGVGARIPHLPRSPMLPGSADQRGLAHDNIDDTLGASPPLELRRPSPSPRTSTVVPLSLQSPGGDRATDSPQVYIHSARIPHPHFSEAGGSSSRYYEGPPPPAGSRSISAEPPPAHHRSVVTSLPPGATGVVVGSASVSVVAAAAASSSHTQLTPPPPAMLSHLQQQREREQREREQRERERERISIPGHASMANHQPNHGSLVPAITPGPTGRNIQVATPPHASQVPPQADSLLMLLQRYPVMWQGLLALKNDQAAVQMHFVHGNPQVAMDSLPCNSDGSTPPLRIAQRMRLEPAQIDGVARKMQMENEHCMLLALPCGRDHMDVLQQSNNLQTGFITYLQQKQAAGIVNLAGPGSQQAAYVVHIFPSCEFANENLARIAPDLLHRVNDIAHLLIVIATV